MFQCCRFFLVYLFCWSHSIFPTTFEPQLQLIFRTGTSQRKKAQSASTAATTQLVCIHKNRKLQAAANGRSKAFKHTTKHSVWSLTSAAALSLSTCISSLHILPQKSLLQLLINSNLKAAACHQPAFSTLLLRRSSSQAESMLNRSQLPAEKVLSRKIRFEKPHCNRERFKLKMEKII